MSDQPWEMPADRRQELRTARSAPDRRSGEDRRAARRLSLRLELTVPVLVRSALGTTRGLARNISEGGMLLELESAPPIGSAISVTISGIPGTATAPDSLTLSGEVRHHLAWQYAGAPGLRTMRGVGIRFLDGPAEPVATGDAWIFATGTTVH